MCFGAARPVAYRRLPRTIHLCRHNFSTQKTKAPPYKSSPFRTATICLAIGISVGYVLQKYPARNNQTPSHTDFYDGSLEWKGKACKKLTLDEAGAWLRKEESSRKGPVGSGVQSWYSVRCPSNSPCEDNLVSSQRLVSTGQDKPWIFWGVFDGHNGWAMSTTLREVLVPYVVRNLSQLYQSFSNSSPTSAAIDEAIISSFKLLDDEIIADGMAALKDAKSTAEVISRLAPGYAGSCADHETLCGLVGLQPPLARQGRDDVTVQVVFFDGCA